MTVVRVGSARYLCDECGRDLSGVSLAATCVCGAAIRRRVDGADTMYRRPTSAESDDEPPWDPLKDWTAKYLQLVWTVHQLRRLYAPGSGAEADEVRRIVITSFRAAVGLGDWLVSGPEPTSVTPGDVARLVETDPLSVCADFGRPDGAANSQVVPIAFSSPPHFWVEHRRPNATPVRYDALDLLERCLRTWQNFLTERGVALPTWLD
ncbi:MAG TPA: hypothetical protein VE442_22590 [Jatrophihabitans sp.]|nr:hypothetical protein [Jatrophihabitans sp.]